MFRYDLMNIILRMIRSLEWFQNKPIIVIVSTTFLLVGFFSFGSQVVSALQSPQTRYNIGYNDGIRHAECDSKSCHDHGHDKPSAHTNGYDEGYAKGYHDASNKASSGDAGGNQRSTQNGTSSLSGTPKSQEVPNDINNNDVCDPTHQFCAMTDLRK
jgi:hypothetical protein